MNEVEQDLGFIIITFLRLITTIEDSVQPNKVESLNQLRDDLIAAAARIGVVIHPSLRGDHLRR